jgi:hypothetical protein
MYIDNNLIATCSDMVVNPSDIPLAHDLFIGRSLFTDWPTTLDAELGCFSIYDTGLGSVSFAQDMCCWNC